MDNEVHYEEQAREAEELRRKEQLRVAELKFPIARYTNLLNISCYMLVQWVGRYLRSTFLTLIRLFLCSDFSTASTGPAAVAVEFPRLTCVHAFAGNCLRWILESVAVLAFGITSQMADETLTTKLILKRKFGVDRSRGLLYPSSKSSVVRDMGNWYSVFTNRSRSHARVYIGGLACECYGNPRAIRELPVENCQSCDLVRLFCTFEQLRLQQKKSQRTIMKTGGVFLS